MPYCILLLLTAVAAQASLYFPPTIQEEHLLAERHRQSNIDTLNDFIDAVNSYAEYFGNSRLSGDFDKAKEIPIDLPGDYETVETFNPNPSIRDQEYLQHSTLWSNQHANDYYRGNDRHRIQAIGSKGGKDDKTENALPAYCTPPNPCPIGYTSENNCLVDFENTAAFSRRYQSIQDCMCDTEHMVDCSSNSIGNNGELPGMRISTSDFDRIVEFQDENPFFQGEKLPIAAKKGTNVVY